MGNQATHVRLTDSVRVHSGTPGVFLWVSELTVYFVGDGDSAWVPIRTLYKLPNGEEVFAVCGRFETADCMGRYERLDGDSLHPVLPR